MAEKRKRKKRRGFIKRNFITIAIILILGSYFVSVIIKQQGMIIAMREEEAQVLLQIAEKERELAEIEAEIETASSETYIEQKAREELDLVRENDIVFRFKEAEETQEKAE